MLKILHAADLHLDSPFAAFSPEEAAKSRAQQRQIPMELVRRCNDLGCHLLLLAGDVLDGERVYPETVEALQKAFAQCKAQVFIAPGNHDPATAQSIWLTEQWPENVHIFTGPMTCVTLPALRCRVWGAGFRAAEAYDLLQPVPQADDGFWEVGVFHGDPVSDGPYHPISIEQLRACGLHYLALGHIHKGSQLQKAGKTWYGWPGCPMGRGFDECGQKGVWYVELGETCRKEALPLPFPKYEILTLSAEALAIPKDAEGSICCLILTGEAEPVDVEAVAARLSDRFLRLEVRDATTPRRDLWAGCGQQTLRGQALAYLKAQYDRAEEAEQPIIAQAVRCLLAALEGREQP